MSDRVTLDRQTHMTDEHTTKNVHESFFGDLVIHAQVH